MTKQYVKTTIRGLRRHNRQTVLQHAYFAQPISRLELSQQLGLSPATVTNVVVELLEEGLLLETGLEESQGGRPRTLLTTNATYGYFVGVDVGETQLQIELFDLNLSRLGGIAYTNSASENTPDQLVDHIVEGLATVLANAQLSREQVLGIGVGLPGIVKRGKQPAVYAPFWDWKGVPLEDQLRERLALPVLVDNGAKAMALAELWFGAGRSVESLVALLIGTGVGAGVITNGALYRGATNSAGEWGHSKVVLDGWDCRCGSRGCLEAYAGAPGILRRFRELAPDQPLPDDQEQGMAALYDLITINHPAALQVLDETARYVGVGIANLVNLFNPRLIILGGWLGLLLGPHILSRVQHYAAEYALAQPFEVVQIGLCNLGLDAVCQGAATIVLEAFLNGRLADHTDVDQWRPKVPAALDPSFQQENV